MLWSSLFLSSTTKILCQLYRLYLQPDEGFGVDFELAYHSLSCGNRVVTVKRLDGFIVENTYPSHKSNNTVELSVVRL